MKDIHAALNETLIQYQHQISAVEISKASKVTEAKISKFRNGVSDIKVDTLNRIIAVLPSEAREFFFKILLDLEKVDEIKEKSLNLIISQMSSLSTSQIGIVLSAAGKALIGNLKK